MENQLSVLAISMERMKQAHRKFDMLNNPLAIEHLGNNELAIVIVDTDDNPVPHLPETKAFNQLLKIEKELQEMKAEMKILLIKKKQIVNFLK